MHAEIKAVGSLILGYNLFGRDGWEIIRNSEQKARVIKSTITPQPILPIKK